MVETVTIGAATLYLGDCREVLPALDPVVHVVVSDPPYGIGYQHSGTRGKRGGRWSSAKHARTPIIGDDQPFDPAPLLRFGNVLVWGADHYRARLPASGRFLAWDKLAGKPSWDSFSDVEFAWHSVPGTSRIISHLWKGICAWRHFEDSVGPRQNNVRRDHPTQKPIRLMRWCIEQAGARPDHVILDPYMGGGTTGVAAMQLGRRFVGIEIERRYFDIACRRIEAAAQAEAKAAA